MMVSLTVNGEAASVEVEGWESLLGVLREHLGLRGTKDSCEQGECGSCSVILDGELVCSCLVMAADADGSTVTTVEGLGDAARRVQEALVEHGGVQCGFCTPGIVVAATHLLAGGGRNGPEDVGEALAGNLCRCTGYGAIVRALRSLGGGS